MEDHPVELTYEEMQSMSMEEIKDFRDKSLKQLEQSLQEVAVKKAEQLRSIVENQELLAKTILEHEKKIEMLEHFVNQLVSNDAFKKLGKDDDPRFNN